MVKWLRNDLRDFEAYHVGEQPYEVKLDANESPYGLPEDVKQAMRDWLENDSLRLYPDTDCAELRAELARFWNISPGNVICGSGSDQIIDFITKAFVEPGDAVVSPAPSFSMYTLAARLNHGQAYTFPLKDDFSLDAAAYIAFAREHAAKVVFLCTPNNPTGNSVPREDILSIAEALDCVVVVDEAYAEFSGSSVIAEINDYPNVIVMRTFSKAYGAAGARVGYGVANEQLIDALNIVKPPYNLNAFSQKLAVEILRSGANEGRIADIRANTADLFGRLAGIPGLRVYKTDGNFVYAEAETPIAGRLAAAGALVRRLTGDMSEKLRISAGTPEQNAFVCQLIERILEL